MRSLYFFVFLLLFPVSACSEESDKTQPRPSVIESEYLATLKQQAEQGDAEAQYNLGQMYRMGEGVPQDSKEAVSWFRKAAEQGYAKAQLFLALMYDNGEGVPQDYKEAYAWYNLAAAKGDENAKKLRDMVAAQLDPKTLSEAQALTRRYFEQYK